MLLRIGRAGATTSARMLWNAVGKVGGSSGTRPSSTSTSMTTTTTTTPPSQHHHPPAPTHAIVRTVSRRFADAIATGAAAAAPIDAARAVEQHARYASLIRAACPSPLRVVELDAPDDMPDACFVEDTSIVVPGAWLPRTPASGGGGGKAVAVIARPAAPSRAREPLAVSRALREHLELRGAVEVLGEITAPGTLDGGDVLILPPPQEEVGEAMATGSPSAPAPLATGATTTTVLVGLSGRTNADGAAQLRDLLAPRGVRVVPVNMAAALARLQPDQQQPPGADPPTSSSSTFHPLHLKSAVTALSAEVLLCADGPAGRAVAAAVHGALLRASGPPAPVATAAAAAGDAAAPSRSAPPPPPRSLPTFAFLPEEDACAANVLLLGDAVVAQPSLEASRRVLEFLCERLGRRLVLLDPPLAEMKKADGALTCCSILF